MTERRSFSEEFYYVSNEFDGGAKPNLGTISEWLAELDDTVPVHSIDSIHSTEYSNGRITVTVAVEIE